MRLLEMPSPVSRPTEHPVRFCLPVDRIPSLCLEEVTLKGRSLRVFYGDQSGVVDPFT
jgi:hypothetical protein